MASGDLERQLGELSGILKGLPPALERMESRLYAAESRAAGGEARYEALRKEFDEWKTKLSTRIADLFHRVDAARLETVQRKGEIEKLASNYEAKIERERNLIENRIKSLEEEIERQNRKREGWRAKAWDVIKLILAAGVGAAVSLLK